MLAGTPADPFLEGGGEDEGVLVADFAGDGFDLLIRRGEEFRGASHAEVGDLLHGRSAQLLETQAAQVFLAEVGFRGELAEAPISAKVVGHFLPQER